jgi:hypothetical protein
MTGIARNATGRARRLLLVVRTRLAIGWVTTVACVVPVRADLIAQGVATAGIRGSVVSVDGSSVDGTRVRVVNTATGHSVEREILYGGFLVQGLEIGGPYVVTLTRLGLRQVREEGILLTLGGLLELDFVMQPEAIGLDTLTVVANPFALINGHGGTATTITEPLVQRLPTLDRNVYDFVRLVPQVSTKVGFQRSGVSAAGANLRFNNFLIDGAEERFVNGNVSAAFNIGKSIPLEAVKEYQVLTAPYDVRYGDFAGALINTVTTSGTNEWRGSTFASWRNDRLARGSEVAGEAPYDQLQYGFALGGPLVRDRVHFFVAPEFQRFSSPAPGPFLGQPSTATPGVPVSEADIERLDEIMRGYGLSAGSAGLVQNSEPLRNLFTRVDATIPGWRSRATVSLTYASAEDQRFSRTSTDTYALSSYQWTLASGLRVASVRVLSDLSRVGGGHNEVIVSQSSDWGDFIPNVHQPLLRILVPGASGGVVTLNAGTGEQAQGRFGRASSVRIRDDLSLPLGPDHVLRLGLQAERFRSERGGVVGGYGVWTFAGLDALEQGVAARYELRKSLVGASTTLAGGQYSAWIGDEWRVRAGISITLGVRADLLHLAGQAPYNAAVDSVFGRRTDRMPRLRVHLSPRIGFAWDHGGSGRGQLRGGVGLFTGRPPLAWVVPALSSYGVGIGVLRCGLLPSDAGTPPAFVRDYRAAPSACSTGPSLTTAPLGDVDLLDRDLKMAQTLRASLAYDRMLPWGLVATTEALVSRHLSDFRWVNLNLVGPQTIDRFGRVLYGTIGTSAVATPVQRSGFAEVIDLRNTSRNYSYQLSTRVEKRFDGGIAATASYTYSRVRDVQSPSRVNLPGIALWSDARAVSGRHEDTPVGISLNDLPHRVVTALTYSAPWRRARTDLSLYYVGESGTPFTYIAAGAGRAGDLNADGSNTNDPIYVPRDVFDANEILFSGMGEGAGADNSATAQADRVRAQQEAFESYMEGSVCLRRQRGRILERNTCREPWSHTLIASVRQSIPIGGQMFEAGLDVFNVLNLLGHAWGRHRIAAPRLLEHVGQTTGAAGTTQPIFRFDTTRTEWTTLETESAFQLQLTLRYRLSSSR